MAISSVIKHRGALEPLTDWTRARQAPLRVTSEQGTAERCKKDLRVCFLESGRLPAYNDSFIANCFGALTSMQPWEFLRRLGGELDDGSGFHLARAGAAGASAPGKVRVPC